MTAFSKDCLSGKPILITGGLGAIGKVVVAELLAHSALVAVNDLVPENDARRWMAAAGWPADQCQYVLADVTKRDQVQSFEKEAAKHPFQQEVMHSTTIRAADGAILDW